ncbi:MAG: exo-alpha-sialidase, partial [Phycisphaerales bacterium]
MAVRGILPIIVVGMLVLPWSLVFAGETDSPVPQPQASADKHEKVPPEARRPVGHLEVPHDAYVAAPRGLQPTSPPALVGRGRYVSVQVNVNASGDNIVGDAANEPSIAVDPTNPSRMAIGWRQFDTISSDFRQAGWGYTTDGGQTWTFPGVIDPGVFRSDPVLDSDADGNFYFNSLTADPIYLTDFMCHVYKSTDGGATWGPGVYAFGGDKQWMTIDRTDGIGRNNIYAYWTRFYTCPGCNGHFCVSYDEGQSFTNLMDVPGSPQWGTLAVGPAGELYVAGDGFVVAKSTTMQDETLPPAFDFSTTVSLDGSMSYSGGPNPGGLLGQVWIAVDHSGGPTHGYVYLLCSVNRYSTSDPLDVMFSRSTDGGQTWSPPVRINDDPGDAAYQWFGTMSVAPNGRIDVIWLDTRNDPGGYDSELYYSYSEDAGQTWSLNDALSPSFDPHIGWPQQNKMGDYFDMVSDNFGANVAYAGTFNGEQDVYYLRIGDPAC